MDELPGLPSTTVRGHGGRFVFGRVGSREVLLQGGRYHAYEGHPNRILTAPMRVLAALGVEVVIMTNAAGGLRSDLQRGDLVLAGGSGFGDPWTRSFDEVQRDLDEGYVTAKGARDDYGCIVDDSGQIDCDASEACRAKHAMVHEPTE